jgi:hypothetical protein
LRGSNNRHEWGLIGSFTAIMAKSRLILTCHDDFTFDLASSCHESAIRAVKIDGCSVEFIAAVPSFHFDEVRDCDTEVLRPEEGGIE